MRVPAGGTFVVAHRGASAYAPEHTAAAYRLAIEQGAEYVEQDLGVTKDGVLVCTHDTMLERTTNVRELFPDRYTEVKTGDRVERHWFVEDLTLAEIKRLDAGAWFGPKFAGATMLTFQEAIDIVKGKAGFFPELKMPSRFRAKGFDIEALVAQALRSNGLVGATFKGRPAVHLQVFEEDSLRRLAKLLPDVPRSFLIGTPDGAKRWLNPAGLAEIRTFATGIAPSLPAREPHAGPGGTGARRRAHSGALHVLVTAGEGPLPRGHGRVAQDHRRDASHAADHTRSAVGADARVPGRPQGRRPLHRQPRPLPALTSRSGLPRSRPCGRPAG